MKSLMQALRKIKSIKNTQKSFIIALIMAMIGIMGNRTFRNLARYMKIDEHTIMRQMSKMFNFVELNAEMIKEITKNSDASLIAAQDETFIEKAGKKTYGVSSQWDGSSGQVKKGLGLDCISVVHCDEKKTAYTLSAQQIPVSTLSKKEKKEGVEEGPNKIDFFVSHIRKVAIFLCFLKIKHIAADAFFAKEKYVTGVVDLGFHVISKLRKDARLMKPYDGPQKARGRKKKFDIKKMNTEENFKDSPIIKVKNNAIELRSAVLYSKSLKREIKVVSVRVVVKNKYKEALLFSTDIKLDEVKIYEFYTARFQIEFIFRDAKGFTGLDHCQSRDQKRLNFHFNASLLALNVAKIQDVEEQKKEQTQHSFSMANMSRKYGVKIALNHIISMLGFDQTLIKSNPAYQSVLEFGRIKH